MRALNWALNWALEPGLVPGRRRRLTSLADGGGIVQDRTLEVVRLDPVEVGDAEGAHASGGQIERGWAAEPAGTNDEDARSSEFLLTVYSHSGQEDVPAVAGKFGG